MHIPHRRHRVQRNDQSGKVINILKLNIIINSKIVELKTFYEFGIKLLNAYLWRVRIVLVEKINCDCPRILISTNQNYLMSPFVSNVIFGL